MHTNLTFEHVPPKSAFNEYPVILGYFEQVLQQSVDEPLKGKIQQGGAGAYTLCHQCNNDTGSWYGHHFVDWTRQGMEILACSRGTPTLIHLHYVFPLAVIKQVVAMFMSANGVGFGRKNPELAEFVLDRERKHLPPKYRIYTYFTSSNNLRYGGVVGSLNMNTLERRTMCEISFPPLGYMMTLGSEPSDKRLFDITHFASYDYKQFRVISLQLPKLDIFTPLAGDYRSEEEVRQQMAEA